MGRNIMRRGGRRDANPMSMTSFHDRAEGGQRLASLLTEYAHRADVVVVGLTRGGVPVAFEVAQALQAPLEVCVVRKLGVPGHEELAMGAIASRGVRVLNEELIERLEISQAVIDDVTARERQELERRERLYRGTRQPLSLQDKTVILVDDGIATGATMRAAIAAVRQQKPATLIVAAPVAAASTVEELRAAGITVVCVAVPTVLFGVSSWYERFPQLTDHELRDFLDRASLRSSNAPDSSRRGRQRRPSHGNT